MKKILLLSLISIGIIGALSAQENKVVSAKMHLDEYQHDPSDSSALKDAKDAIDLAAANDKTKDEPKMWLYRAHIYRTIFERSLSGVIAKVIAKEGKPSSKEALMKLTANAYATLDTTPICIAANSYMRVIQLEPTKAYADEARQFLPLCAGHLENKAVSDNDHEKYASALAMFEKALVVGRAQGLKDTTEFMVQNIQNCAITADKMHNTAKATMYYQKLIDMKQGGAQPYTALITLYNDMKDTAKAMDVLRKGRVAYPNDVNLLISEINYYLESDKTNQAIDNLQTAINKLAAENKPENKDLLSKLYFVLGNTYDRLAHPKDKGGKALPKPKDYDDLFAKAETNYSKASELTSDNFDLFYDFGALYNNRANDINQEANDMPYNPNDTKANEKFNKLQEEANGYLKKAQPWLEKAHTINPADKLTISALLQIYTSTNQSDKAKALRDGK